MGRVRFNLSDTYTSYAVFGVAETKAFLARYEGLAVSRRDDWVLEETVESILTNDSPLVGKTTVLGVNLDTTPWWNAVPDQIAFPQQRRIMGPG